MAGRELLVTLGLNATSYTTNVKRIKSLTKDLDKDFELISSSVKDFEGNLDGLGKKTTYLSNKIEHLSAQSQLYTKRLRESEEGLVLAQASADDYRQAIAKLEKEMAGMDKSSDIYKQQKEELKALQQLLNKAEKSMVTYNQRILDAKVNYSQTQTELQKYSKELNLTKEKMDALEVDNKFENMNKDLEKSSEQFKRIKSSVDDFGKNMESLVLTEKHYSEQKKETNKLLGEYTKEIDKSKLKITEYTNKVEELKKEHEEWDSLMRGMDETRSDYEEVRQEVERLRQAYSDANSVLEFHSERVENIGKKYDVAKQKMSNMEGIIDKTKKSMKSLGDVKEFKKLQDEIKDLEDEIQELDNRFLITSTTMGKYESSLKGLADKKQYLKEKIVLLDDSIEKMNTTYVKHFNQVEKLKDKQEELTKELEESRQKLNAMSTADAGYEELAIEVAQAENKLESLNAEIKEHRGQLSSLDREIASTTAEFNSLSRELVTLDAQFVSNRLESFSNSMKSVGQNITNVGQALAPISLAFAGLGGTMVKTGAEFQQQMKNVAVLTGETGAELEKTLDKLTEKAIEVGEKTKYSSTEAGQGLEYLILAGYDAEQAIASLETVVSLATVGKMDMKTSSDLLTDSLGSLGSVTKNSAGELLTMDEYTNQLAYTSTKANSTVEDLMRAFVTFGGQADNMNIPLSTSNTLLGILADQGFKAEQAGNSLSSILINLTQTTGQSAKAMEQLGVSAFDADGNIRPIEETLFDVKQALKSFGEEEKEVQLANMLGGKTQAKTLMKLLNGISDETADFTGKYKDLRDELEKGLDTSTLKNMATEIEDTLTGDFDRLSSAFDSLLQDMFKVAEPRLRELVQKFTKFIDEIHQKWNELGKTEEGQEMQNKILNLISAISLLAPALIVLGTSITILGSVASGAKAIVDFFGIFKKGGQDVGDAVDTIAQSETVFSRLINNMGKWSNSLKTAIFPAITGFFRGIGTQIGTLFTTSILPLISGALSSAGTWIGGALSTIGGWISTGLTAIGTFISGSWIWIAIAVAVAGLVAIVVKNWDSIKQKTMEIWENISTWLEDTWNNITSKAGEIWNNVTESLKTGVENARKAIIEGWEKVVDFFKQAPQMIKQALEKGFEFMGELGAVIIGNFIGGIVTTFANLTQVIKGIFGVLEGVFDVIVGIFTLNGDKIKEGVKGIFTSVGEMIWNIVSNIWQAGVGMLDNITQLFGFSFRDIAEKITEWLGLIALGIVTWVTNTALSLWEGFENWKLTIETKLGEIWTGFTTWCWDMFNGLITWLGEFVLNTLLKMDEWRTNIINTFTYIKENFWTWVGEFLYKCLEWLGNLVYNTIMKMDEWRTKIINAFQNVKENFWTWVGEFIKKAIQWGSDLIQNGQKAIKDFGQKIKDGFDKALEDLGKWISDFITDLQELPSKLVQIGRDMVDKLWSGFTEKISGFATNVKNAVNNVIGGIKFWSLTPEVDITTPNVEGAVPAELNTLHRVAVNPVMGKMSMRKGSISDMFASAFNLNNYKTNGGFYEPQPIVVNVQKDEESSTKELINMLMQQNQLLMKMVQQDKPIEVAVNVDGKQIAKASARYMENEITNLNYRKNRLGGAF